MAGNKRANKARNQTTGNRRGLDNARWFDGNVKRTRKRNKIAKASRKKNR